MSLTPGTQLGSCEILGLIGTGGMGEVYRGRDLKLGREVAVKTLPAHFTHDPERLARFEREAQMIAALNHPNLAAIHELKEIDGAKYLILELVEGETLAERIVRGPIPLDEALDIGRQTAEALEAAHEKGIVHRDLKPANIKVTAEGHVKVLDFGLAKLADPAAAPIPDGFSNSPTLSALQTAGGVILGTAAYMSPEQARGRKVDRRADIWAFGCVLFEMLAGRNAFPHEETVSDTLAAILKGEPDWRALPVVPSRVRTLLERCLRKDLRRRLPDIAVARIELEEVLNEPGPVVSQEAPAMGPRWQSIWATVALTSLLAAVALAAWIVFQPQAQPRVVHVEIFAPDGTTIASGQPLSPDGRRIAFVAGPEGKRQIWIRPLDSAVAQPIPGTEGAERLVWSADSQSIAFFADGRLKKMSAAGGPASVICNEPGRDAAWSREGVILIGGQGKPLLRVSALGGQPTPATEFGPSETTHDYPDFLPDGRHFLYMVRRGTTREDREVYVGSLDSKERVLLPGVHSGARYSPTGHVLFLEGGTLMAQRFDVERLELKGDAFAIAEQVEGGLTTAFAVSENGSLAYLKGTLAAESQLAWFNPLGKQLALVGERGRYANVELSPNGKLLAFERDNDVFLLDLDRNLTSPLMSHPAADFAPKWSPDSRTIAFSSSRDPAGNMGTFNRAAGNLYERGVGVVGEERLLLKTDAGKTMSDWSPDGRHIIYESGRDLWALPVPVSDASKPLRVTDTPFVETQARVSPDGRWIAYASSESGNRLAVYVQSFLTRGAKQQVSTGAGVAPRWSHDGGELFYVVPAPTTLATVSAGTLTSVSIKAVGSELQIGAPVPLFSIRGGFNISRDGRFLLDVTSADTVPAPITVIHNWSAVLDR
jgi:Tol biopolymer transport system component